MTKYRDDTRPPARVFSTYYFLMPFNIPGLLAPFQLLLHPRLAIPNVIVKDIRYIDFAALRKAGYRGAVFDKDNCLTIPYQDTLVPELESAWSECRKTFGENNVIVVSNSAGTYTDPGGIQSESVSYHLQAPVLSHKVFKPGYSCINSIRTYFSSLHRPISDDELIVVGDRIFTDVVMANRMRLTNPRRPTDPSHTPRPRGLIGEAFSCIYEKGGTLRTEREGIRQDLEREREQRREKRFVVGRGPLAIWTTGVWEKEAMGMRWFEKKIVQAIEKWSTPREGETGDSSRFIRRIKLEERRPSFLNMVWSRFTSA